MASFTMKLASASDLPDVIQLLDRVFVTPQQRTPSLAVRYRWLQVPGERNRAWVIREGDRIAACVLAKRRTFKSAHSSFELTMIGGLCTDPEARGRGMGTQLMLQAEAGERASGVTAMVLWANQVQRYERLGWEAEDPALLGTLRECPGSHPPAGFEISSVSPTAAMDRLELIRHEWLTEGIIREADDYATIPFPAQTADCLVAAKDGCEAYALIGGRGETGFVYEVIGSPEALGPLWVSIRQRYATVYINDWSGSPTMRWLEVNARVEWQPRPLAMWKGAWRSYVPYFDRI